MQSKDHILLGKYILIQQNLKLPLVKKLFFLFGCIEPDLNPLTYTRGSLRHKFLHGHHAENAKKHLSKIIKKMRNSGIHTRRQWFIFGTALHYLADSFTFAHNSDFSGGLREHRYYESLLHPVFLRFLRQSLSEAGACGTKINTIDEIQSLYKKSLHSFLTDCDYILKAAANLCDMLQIKKICD